MKVLVHSSNDPVVSDAPNSGIVRARGGAAGRSIASGECAISPDRKPRRPRARQRAASVQQRESAGSAGARKEK